MKNKEIIYPLHACKFEENEGLITVLVKKEKLSFIEKIFFKKAMQKPYKIDLDKIGTYIWGYCNGEKSIDEIIKLSREKFGAQIEPVEERVELFINQMHKNKLVNLFIKK